jgi:hypothetical protein
MGFIIKNTSALISSKLTDTGRQRLSQGNFNISYFQIGDGEVTYDELPPNYNQQNSMVLDSIFNAQNSTGNPNSNKQHVKYPYYVNGLSGSTYGIPFQDSVSQAVFNTASPRGFFSGNGITWSAYTDNDYVINSTYVTEINTLDGGNIIELISSGCSVTSVREPEVGDFLVLVLKENECDCYDFSTSGFCGNITGDTCLMGIESCYPMLTYRIIEVCTPTTVKVDRTIPDFSMLTGDCVANILIYPPTITEIYDSFTPSPHFNSSVINFESVCFTDELDVNILNMNIPWSENPAGMDPNVYTDYSKFGSANYLGTKEFLGYASSSGQTDTDKVYFYNSFGEQVIVEPKEQKAISIIHYTNNSVNLFYGEKFAMEPFDPLLTFTTAGLGRNFKLHIPWLMWHKSEDCCGGQTFWVDPPGFGTFDLFQVEYLESTKNDDMNHPGIRYFHLWDTNPNSNGLPNRIGKVFPDQQIIVIDDEEIIAALSYKSNRNWTLPAPKLSLVTPNTCGGQTQSSDGILSASTQYLYVTYRLTNSTSFTNSLHCNYYIKIKGPNLSCGDVVSQNIAVRFGEEFKCLNQILTDDCDLPQGYYADKFEVICQFVNGEGRPEPDDWKIINMTDYISGTTVNGYLTESGLTNTTFVIDKDTYDNANFYDLGNYIELSDSSTTVGLNFGDEYFFYGNLETDIQATIYEMRYQINIGDANFQTSSNPTHTNGTPSYITEIGLYNDNKELMIISKLQSPVLRQGTQQFLIKFDF